MCTQKKYWNQHMSNEAIQHGHHEGPEFERQDMSPKAVYGFLVGLAIMCVLAYFIIDGVYHVLDSYARNHQPPMNPLVTAKTSDTRVVTPADINSFPQPRLETDERNEIYNFRLQEEQKLHSYGWVDQNAGVVRIPIDRAMELIAQRGLPTTPRAGTVPPSPVNMTRKAAASADKKK
jgi:hypothetical protein